MDDCHAFYLWQKIMQAIIGSADTAHTKYEADSLDWQSVINDSHELLCKADMLQFKELCDINYLLCEDEYDLNKEWTQVIEARPRYINIMYGRIADKDEQAWNNDKIQCIILTATAGRHFSLRITRCRPIISGSPVAQRRPPCSKISW
jgi:hypothetical protein